MDLPPISDVLDNLPMPPPLLVVVVVALLVGRVVLRPRRDPVRWFDATQRAKARAYAGGRCEYTSWGRRCPRPAQEIDHYIAHARGGATSMTNAVAACRRHNQAKGATVLPWWHAKALERRRRGYFPPGVPVKVGQRYRLGVAR